MSEITQPSVKSYRDTFAEFRQPAQGLPLPPAGDGGGKLNVLIEVANPLVPFELDPANADRRALGVAVREAALV